MLFALTLDRSLAIRAGNERFGFQAADIPLADLSEPARSWLADHGELCTVTDYPGARKKNGAIPPALDLDELVAIHDAGIDAITQPGVLNAKSVSALIEKIIATHDQRERDLEEFRFMAATKLRAAIQAEDPEAFLKLVPLAASGRVQHRFALSRDLDDVKAIPAAATSALASQIKHIEAKAIESINARISQPLVSRWADALRPSMGVFNTETRRYTLALRLNFAGVFESSDAFGLVRELLEYCCEFGTSGQKFAHLFKSDSDADASIFDNLKLEPEERVLFLNLVLKDLESHCENLVRKLNAMIAAETREMEKIASAALARAEEVIAHAVKYWRNAETEEADVIKAYAEQYPEEKILERLAEKVLPDSERLHILRQHAFAPISQFDRFKRIEGSELGVSQQDLRCSTEECLELDKDAFNAKKTLEKHLANTGGAKISIQRHTCQSHRGAISRLSARIELNWNGRYFTRELAVPLVARGEQIATRLTDKARVEFLAWVNSVKAPRVSAEACLDEFEKNLGTNQAHYELGSYFTASRNPATISFKASELVWEAVGA